MAQGLPGITLGGRGSGSGMQTSVGMGTAQQQKWPPIPTTKETGRNYSKSSLDGHSMWKPASQNELANEVKHPQDCN